MGPEYLVVASDQRPFWSSGSCRVWVGVRESGDDAGALVFTGEDTAYLGDPGHSYEYWVTVRPDQFPKLLSALRADPGADVVDLVCSHADEIMARGERSWLDDHDIDRGFHCY